MVNGVQETLTGFKWMGNRAHELLQQGHEVLFAFEEAIGYMCGCRVLDKDGISAAAVMAEFAGWLAGQGKNFRQQLDELYARSAKEPDMYIQYTRHPLYNISLKQLQNVWVR